MPDPPQNPITPPELPPEVTQATQQAARRRGRWAITCAVTFVIGYCGRWMPGPLVWISALCVPLCIYAGFRFARSSSTVRRDMRRRELLPLEAPPAAPVLYLRSFRDDRAAGRLIGKLTEEEHLTKILGMIGPVVAIGRPREYRPELGAARMYKADEEWRGSVQGMLQSARLVVIRTGSSAGLLWEIEQTVRAIPPERLLIVVDSTQEMQDCLTQIRKLHPHTRNSLPIGSRRIGSMRCFLIFDRHWQVSRLRLRWSPLSRRTDGAMIQPRLMYTLRPVFSRLHAPWKKPRLDWAKCVVALCIAGIWLVLLASAI